MTTEKMSKQQLRAMFAQKRSIGRMKNPEGPATDAQKRFLENSGNLAFNEDRINNLSKAEASAAIGANQRLRWLEVVEAIQGAKPTNHFVENEVNKLTIGQRLEANEALQRRASRMGKASPLELPPSQIRDVLRRVKLTTPRLGV